jgi:hypothetical protein
VDGLNQIDANQHVNESMPIEGQGPDTLNEAHDIF